jgi:PTS system ascorbate-specific IIA component
MPRLYIVAHAPLARALEAVARHAFPECAATLRAVDVQPDEDPLALEAGLRTEFVEGEALVLCDAFGATPCNVVQRAAEGLPVRIVAGVSVPMVWRALCYAGEPLDAWAARAVAGGAQGAMPVAATRPQNQSARVRTDAAIHHHDQ